MTYCRNLPLVVLLTIASCGLAPRDAQAGPLLDWLFGRNRTAPAYPVGGPVPIGNGYGAGYGASAVGSPAAVGYGAGGYGAGGYAGNYGTYYSTQLPTIGPAGAGYTAPMPGGIAAATLPNTLSYVPNFQTYSQRAPVTYYRPLLTTDPRTGAQVVAMAPCTSYEYMAQRAPTWGRSALLGSNAPPVFAPPTALPTYTLPSGGIPLAASTPVLAAPNTAAYAPYDTLRGYGAYSNTQPAPSMLGGAPSMQFAPTSVGPAGAYPTTPLGQAYYGSVSGEGAPSGGSCGGYSGSSTWQSVPGLVAPPSPAAPNLNYSTPAYPGTAIPPTTSSPAPSGTPYPGSVPPSGILPPNSVPGGVLPGSADPADQPPQLPAYPSAGASAQNGGQSSARPQLRSITRQPRAGETPQVSSNPASEGAESSQRSLPTMLPIPAPEDFQHQPRWNPPLLRDGDLTAMRPVDSEVVQLAGQSKPIHWASFETSRSDLQPSTASTAPLSTSSPSGKLRPVLSPAAVEPPTTAPSAMQPLQRPATRETNGWKVKR
jgi:hypothetical protein